MCEGSFLPSSFGPHQKHTEFESSLRSYPIHPSPQCNRQARSSQTPSGLDRTQADRETTLHAPQSGSAWIGGSARAVAWSSFRCISAERQGRCASTIQTFCRCEFARRRSEDRCQVVGPRSSQNRGDPGTPAPPGLACGEDIFLARDPGHPRWEEQVKACRAMERT